MAEPVKLADITPETKIGPLLEAYPALEHVLLDMSPHFARLKNPVLRKTVAKIATLRQVAEIGGVALPTLINTLRGAVGLDTGASRHSAEPEHSAIPMDAPAWFASRALAVTYDARPDLAQGMHPAQRVMSDLQTLGADDMYLLVTPFTPAPLIDLASGKGYTAWSHKEDNETVKTYFTPA
jgi:hypothetical protein